MRQKIINKVKSSPFNNNGKSSLLGVAKQGKGGSFVDKNINDKLNNKSDDIKNGNVFKSHIGSLFSKKENRNSKVNLTLTTPRIKNIKSLNSLHDKKSRSLSLNKDS